MLSWQSNVSLINWYQTTDKTPPKFTVFKQRSTTTQHNIGKQIDPILSSRHQQFRYLNSKTYISYKTINLTIYVFWYHLQKYSNHTNLHLPMLHIVQNRVVLRQRPCGQLFASSFVHGEESARAEGAQPHGIQQHPVLRREALLQCGNLDRSCKEDISIQRSHSSLPGNGAPFMKVERSCSHASASSYLTYLFSFSLWIANRPMRTTSWKGFSHTQALTDASTVHCEDSGFSDPDKHTKKLILTTVGAGICTTAFIPTGIINTRYKQ